MSAGHITNIADAKRIRATPANKLMCAAEQPPSHGDTDGADDKKKTFYERLKRDIENPRFAVEVVALVFLIIYTIFTGSQSCKIRTSTDAAVAATRAWIVYTGQAQMLPIEPGESSPRIGFVIIDAGKTSAIDLFTSSEFKFSRNKIPVFGACQEVDKRTSGPNIPYLAPSEPVMMKDPLPYGDTLEEKQILKLHPPWALYLHECIRYHDVVAKKERVTAICLDVFTMALVSACSEFK